jgi:colanic acid biosynthesis glycosyl transferase WcaI
MRLLILGLNYSPEPVGIGPYTEGLATALAQAGHSISVVAAKPYYPAWKITPAYRGGYRYEHENGVDLVRCPLYIPARPSGVKRILHHASFALTALMPMLSRARQLKPDVVIIIAPALVAAPVALLAARLSRAKSWIHVQDLEVEAAFATGLLDPQSRIGRWAKRFETATLKAFDHISSISPQMCTNISAKGIAAKRITQIRNWANIDCATHLETISPYRDEWKIETPHVALYSGNIANKQGIQIVVAAARALRNRSDLTFVVCGEGPNRDRLIASAADLTNIRFYPLQPRERLGDLLSLATIHLLPQIAGAADLVLPSKLTNMLASGRPIIACADPGTGLAEEVGDSGLIVPPDDVAAFANGIVHLLDDATLRQQLGTFARIRAEQRWSKLSVVNKVEETLASLVAT